MQPDQDVAIQFLSLLDPECDKFTFQCFKDVGSGVSRPIFSTLEGCWSTLVDYNNQGYGVFITVNECDGKGRKASNVIRARALFRDIDHPEDVFILEESPSITVHSSPNKRHEYFLLDNCTDLDAWKKAETQFVEEWGGDKAVKDLPRVLRLPGFFHMKDDPFMVTLDEDESTGAFYELPQLTEYLQLNNVDVLEESLEQAAIAEAEKEATTIYPTMKRDRVESMLDSIVCADLEYDVWLKVGMSLRTWDNEEGFDVWDAWSRNDERYIGKEMETKWESFDDIKYQGNPVTVGFLIWLAKECGWEPAGDDLVENYIYVKADRRYYGIEKGTALTTEVFNDIHIAQYRGLKGSLPIASKAFLLHSAARMVDNYTWQPTPFSQDPEVIIEKDGLTLANQYRKPFLQPVKGPVTQWLNLLSYLIPDKKIQQAYISWMAFTLQRPDVKINWQILHWGTQRLGKDSIITPLIHIMGRQAGQVTQEQINGNFNGYIDCKKLLVFQEIYKPGDKEFENMLKILAADTAGGNIRINPKYGIEKEQPNLVSFVAFSNHEDCLHLSEADSRYLVIHSPQPALEGKFYLDYYGWLHNEHGIEKVMNYLLKYNIDNFNYGQLPIKTQAYYDMVKSSRPIWVDWLDELLGESNIMFMKKAHDVVNTKSNRDISERYISRWMLNLGWENFGQGMKKVKGKTKTTPRLWCRGNHVEKYAAMSKSELFDEFSKCFGKIGN